MRVNQGNDMGAAGLRLARGERFVRLALLIMMLTSVHVIVTYVVARGTDRLPIQLIRFALTLGLALMVWRGRQWARALTIALLGAGAALSLTSLESFLVLGGPYLAAVGLLLTPHASVFLAQQRRR